MMKKSFHFLPFWNERPENSKIKALVLHCSAYHTENMIDVLADLQLSAHYIIDTDGVITQLVVEKQRAWHAGVSRWRNMENLNHWSIGIELTSLTMGQTPYPEKQLKSAVSLCRQIIKHYQIPLCNVVAHSDIAPTRKPDPGKDFPWEYLARKGVGLWYDLSDAAKVRENNVVQLLRLIGYDTDNSVAASYAFCRHFIPEIVQTVENKDALQQQVYPVDFVFPDEYLPVLKACAYKYGNIRKRR